MEKQSAEDGPGTATIPNDRDSLPGVPSIPTDEGSQLQRPEWSGSSPQSSSTYSKTDESKPEESTPTSSSSYRPTLSGARSSPRKQPGTPRSETSDSQSKRHSCLCCNPVIICLLLGLSVAMGSVAMTVCGYMSDQISMHIVIEGNDTIATIDEQLRGQIERFRTFGPVLIGLGSFISMCACVLLCEARDERRRQKEKRLAEEIENADYLACQEHLYELQREVIECENRRKLQHESSTDNRNKKEEDVDSASRSVRNSPVVLVHGPSLAEANRGNVSQESSDRGKGAHASLLREQPRIDAIDNTSVPTCSKYDEPELETSFTAVPHGSNDSTVGSQSPKPAKTKLERPSKLSPLKARSVNGPISFDAPPPFEGVCLCGVEAEKPPTKGGKYKRVKRGTRGKKKELDATSAGSDADGLTNKHVPSKSKSSAPVEPSTHVNPLHDIELHNISYKSPHRTVPTDTKGKEHRVFGTPTTAGRSSGSTAPHAHANKPGGKTSQSPTASRRISDHADCDSASRDVWIRQDACEASSNNNNGISRGCDGGGGGGGGGGGLSSATKEGALCNPGPGPLYRDNQCDGNSNVCPMSSMQRSPDVTPSKSNIMYDVIHGHGKSHQMCSTKSEVVL